MDFNKVDIGSYVGLLDSKTKILLAMSDGYQWSMVDKEVQDELNLALGQIDDALKHIRESSK